MEEENSLSVEIAGKHDEVLKELASLVTAMILSGCVTDDDIYASVGFGIETAKQENVYNCSDQSMRN